MAATKLYTIGKGKLIFKPTGGDAYIDLGNCPDFKIKVTTSKKEHFSSRSGLQTKDAEVVVRQEATGTFTLDEPNAENINLFIMSSGVTSLVQASGTTTASSLTLAGLDEWVSLGKQSIETGTLVVTNDAGSTTYTCAPTGTDYESDLAAGLIRPLTGGTIAADASVKVTFDYEAITVKRADAATATTVRGDIWFVSDPPVGKILDVKGYVSLTPNGDLDMIGENWTSFGFSMEFLSGYGYNGLFELYDRGTVV